ncbi:cardiac-enriched FHL2-interacting protein [Rhynchocyon petersi]
MQGNKKGTDGFSDSSSIGSLLDEADREVSSLTDRAFRSLCISEDTSFRESPDLACQVLGSLHQGAVSHTQRKSGLWSQLPTQGEEHAGWAATFQQLPKYVQGEEKYPKGSPPPVPAHRKLEVPVSGLRSSNKPLSKVSSLIKSFDRPESQRGDSRPPPSKPPTLKTAPKFAPLPDSGVNFCFDSAFLTVRRVPAEVSCTHPSGRKPGDDESSKNPEAACHSSSSFLPAPKDASSPFESKFHSPTHKPAKGEPRGDKEWAPKGTFLHSENSAFESWSTHQPRLVKRKEPAEGSSESKGPLHYQDMPLLREPKPPESKVSPSQVWASCSQEDNRLPTGALSTSGVWDSGDPGGHAPTDLGNSPSTQPALLGKPAQAPWRKSKAAKGGRESLQEVAGEQSRRHTKPNAQGQFPEDEAPDLPVDSSEHHSPPFNISKLLTPIIPTKHVLDSLNSQPTERIPSPQGQPNGYQEKEPGESQSQDSYKSKAPSLLFNLKDVRKRVKSTYSPSCLLKSLDEQAPDKVDGMQETISNGVILSNGLEDSPASQLSKERMPGVSTTLCVSTEKELRPDPSESSTNNYPALSSTTTTAKTSFWVNGEAEVDGSEKGSVDGEAKLNPTRSDWDPESSQNNLRKHLSLQLCSQEVEAVKGPETTPAHQLQNGFLRSVSHDTEPEREAGLQNADSHQKPSPGALSPEEEDVFYSDSQSDFMPGLQSKAKFSTSSSDQSFASFEDQQKTWCVESQQEDRKNVMSASGGESSGKGTVAGEGGPQDCTERSGHASTDEKSEEQPQRDRENVTEGRPETEMASTEAAHFGDSWVEGSKATALSQAKDISATPSSTSNKHILFTIKDNTLRATPVIKPIMLPLLRTVSSEDSIGGGQKEATKESPRLSKDAGPCALESQGMPGTQAAIPRRPTSTQPAHWRHTPLHSPEGLNQASGKTKTETVQPSVKGDPPSSPLVVESEDRKSPRDVALTGVRSSSSRSSTEQGRLGAPKCIPKITFPEDNTEEEPSPHLLERCWEEQVQGFKRNLLSIPRTGALGRRLGPSDMTTSPNPSSLEGDSTYSPTASSAWEDVSQAPSDLGLPQQDPWAGLGPAPATWQDDPNHAMLCEEASHPKLKPTADLRSLSPRGSLVDLDAPSAGLPERREPFVQAERPVGKPPAVPPKTEKALRRAKKLASKRRKKDQGQGRSGEPWEDRPWPEDPKQAEQRPLSPEEMPRRLSFPSVRSLPPPVHRHSVSSFSEHSRRQPAALYSAKSLLPYPTTQKVLQDPQSGKYFVFDLPLQMKIKTFYDPETGQYLKVSIPSSAGGSPEPPAVDPLATPLLLFPGLRPLPVTSLTPLRSSSQLSAPTFLWQRPPTASELATVGRQGSHEAGLQHSPRAFRNSTQNAPGQSFDGPPQNPEKEDRDASSLEIITINDLEDFATEGIS